MIIDCNDSENIAPWSIDMSVIDCIKKEKIPAKNCEKENFIWLEINPINKNSYKLFMLSYYQKNLKVKIWNSKFSDFLQKNFRAANIFDGIKPRNQSCFTNMA